MTPLEDRLSPHYPIRGRTYLVSNEPIRPLYLLAQSVHPTEIVAIAGGGEQTLLAFLPLGVPVNAVDVNVNSLTATALKAEWLKNYTTKEIKQQVRRQILSGVFNDLIPALDPTLQLYGASTVVNLSAWSNLRHLDNAWLKTPNQTIDAARESIGLLTLTRANVLDMTMPPANLLYLSNLPYFTEGLYVQNEVFAAATMRITEGGHLLVTRPFWTPRPATPPGLEFVDAINHSRIRHWTASELYQRV